MNDDNGVFGEILESAGTAIKQTGKTAANAVSDTAKATVSQITGSQGDSSAPVPATDTDTQDVVESLYEKSQPQNTNSQQTLQQGLVPNILDKTPQEEVELEVVRKRLHDEYYQSLINPPKQEEESVTEKIVREDQQEDMELQQKEMEKPPELVQRAAQRVEKNPGASG